MPTSNLPDWFQTLLTFLGGGLMAQIFQWGRERRKERLASDSALQETIDRRVKIILEDDERTISRLQKQMAGLEKYVSLLVAVMQKAGIPVPDRPWVDGQ